MGTSLFGLKPKNTYQGLLKTTDNSAIDATSKFVSDGLGNDSALSLSTIRVGVGTAVPSTTLDVNGSIRAGVNLTVVGEIQNPTVGVVNINGELRVASPNVSIGLTTYPARLAIKGSGSTSATTSLLVQNSSSDTLLRVRDNGNVSIGNGNQGLDSPNGNFSDYLLSTGIFGNVFGTFTSFAASAIVQCDSTTRGFLPPRMTDAQARAIATPADGLVVYNTTISHLCCYQAGAWVKFNHSPM